MTSSQGNHCVLSVTLRDDFKFDSEEEAQMLDLAALAGPSSQTYKGDGRYEMAVDAFVECFVEVQQAGLRDRIKKLLLDHQPAAMVTNKIDTTSASQQKPKDEASLQATQSRSLVNQAARQVDFYFSDKNYVRDAYMKDLAGRDPARWVCLSEILAFNKMRVLMRGLDHAELIEALKRH